MVRPVSFKGFQKGFQGVSLRGFRGFQIFLWELCVCIKYLSLGDPACGSGNFLTETYVCLRRLENEVLLELHKGQVMFADESTSPIQVSISQFYGIEINDFAVTVAKTALWIAESQMMKETEDVVLMSLDFLPLKTNASIIEGNALRMDWERVVPKQNLNYIMGIIWSAEKGICNVSEVGKSGYAA